MQKDYCSQQNKEKKNRISLKIRKNIRREEFSEIRRILEKHSQKEIDGFMIDYGPEILKSALDSNNLLPLNLLTAYVTKETLQNSIRWNDYELVKRFLFVESYLAKTKLENPEEIRKIRINKFEILINVDGKGITEFTKTNKDYSMSEELKKDFESFLL